MFTKHDREFENWQITNHELIWIARNANFFHKNRMLSSDSKEFQTNKIKYTVEFAQIMHLGSYLGSKFVNSKNDCQNSKYNLFRKYACIRLSCEFIIIWNSCILFSFVVFLLLCGFKSKKIMHLNIHYQTEIFIINLVLKIDDRSELAN